MGIIKEIFSGGVSRPDLKADFVRVPAARPDGATEKAFDPSQHRGMGQGDMGAEEGQEGESGVAAEIAGLAGDPARLRNILAGRS